ncbi:coagulation factor 5/8 type [Phytohabitans aurantiacus]|uniref:Coagulation factor 5/8 type n=1 Tax=Phytohabitans aurantiacus TaxID=3016789 RepID=A0ABQ5QTA5_9ACTN|nr:coagulation factor 5/8 type [Phytohabitans aurantiacus]
MAVCVFLTALAFFQAPGMTVIDTKVDLAVTPIAWLERALHVWEPAGTFGQLQNQAYGYLWPMGPFFAGGWLLAIPAWAIQRLWWALLMCVAFTGVVKLADRLGIGTPASRLIAGIAFALCPRIVTELGPVSVEAWPTAVAPWVLVPLVGIAKGASIRRSVAWSALAVACAGGVNATAVLAVVPLAVLWLATVRPLKRRVAALAGWCVAVAFATAWWVVPLLLLGRYSPPFLDYIETSEVTTRTTDLVTTMRGASHWLAYLGGPHGPTWTAGWQLGTEPLLIAATLVVAGIGLAGLARRGMPHRRFLVTGLLVGVALVGFGHVASASGGLAELQRAFLDGSGAPLRNVHKFDVVLRLPLILGLAHVLGVLSRAAAGAPRWHLRSLRAAAVTGASLVAVAAVAAPALVGGLPAKGSFNEVPGYWKQASTWLDANLGRERVLVAPAARFPRYLWGSPSDEILQPLLDSAWAVRSSIPLAPPATIRLLDAIESTMATGAGSTALADVLARSGVRYVLIRSDLNYGDSDAARPLLVRQALTRSPGLTLAAGFGPMVGGGHLPSNYSDRGLDVPVRALEVFRVQRPVDQVVAYDLDSVTRLVGGPESLLELGESGLLPQAPTVLAGDLPDGVDTGSTTVTDGLRRREVAFGRAQDNASNTLTSLEPWRLDTPQHDYLPSWVTTKAQTTVRYLGFSGVSASSSMSQALSLSGGRPANQPYAALDGDTTTSWRSAPGTLSIGQWLEVELTAPRVVTEVRITFDTGADSIPTRITVAAGPDRVTTEVSGTTAVVRLPGRFLTERLRVTVNDVFGMRTGFGGVGITELTIPDLRTGRTLVTPEVPVGDAASSIVLSAAPSVPSCYFLDNRTYCSPAAARASEDNRVIDRTVRLGAADSYRPAVWAVPKAGPELSALLDSEYDIPSVAASSSGMPDPAARPGVVADGNPTTVWYAADDDKQPWLRLTWPKSREITGLKVALHEEIAASHPWSVTVLGDGGVRGGVLSADGTIAFDRPMTTNEITVLLSDTTPARSYDPYGNKFDPLPVAVAELTALPDKGKLAVDEDAIVRLPCGSGPILNIAGTTFATSIRATRKQLLELREVWATVCKSEEVELPAGESRVVAAGTTLATPTRLALTTSETPEAEGSHVSVSDWSASERHVTVAASSKHRVLVLRENANPGWIATAAGETLRPITIDGWQQGWVLPAGVAGDVTLRFGPDRQYQWGLAGGATLALIVLVVALLSRRGPLQTERVTRHRYRRPMLVTVVGGLALVSVGGLQLAALAALGGAGLLIYRALMPNLSRYDQKALHRGVQLFWRWLPVALFAIAGVLSLAAEDPHWSAAPQVVALAAASALWLSFAVRTFRRGHREPSH